MNEVDGVFVRYVGRLFAVRFIALLTFFVIVLQMLDLLNRSEDILTPDGAGMDSIVRYISLRAPQIVSQFTPFAALLGIVVTLSSLNITSEIVIMRAAGMSVHKVLFPVGAVCLMITVTHFLFHEIIVAPNAEKLAYWEANEYALDLSNEATTRTNVRINHEREVIYAESAARADEAVIMREVLIYTLDDNGLAKGVIEAERAVYQGEEWRIYNVSRSETAGTPTIRTASEQWSTDLNPELLFALTLDPEKSSLPALFRQISQLRSEGADARSAMTSLLSRLSRPMATLLMPLLGAVAGFGVSRQGNQLVRASGGAVLGFGYFVSENLMLAIGKLGVAPPMIAAFFPLALFMVVGFALLLAMEN